MAAPGPCLIHAAVALPAYVPQCGKGGRGKKDPAKTSKSLGGFSGELLRQARAVLAYSPAFTAASSRAAACGG